MIPFRQSGHIFSKAAAIASPSAPEQHEICELDEFLHGFCCIAVTNPKGVKVAMQCVLQDVDKKTMHEIR